MDKALSWFRETSDATLKLFDQVVIDSAGQVLMPFVGVTEGYKLIGDGFEEKDLLSEPTEGSTMKKPSAVRKHNEAIQSQLREGAFLGTLHLPVEYGGFYKSKSEEIFRCTDRRERRLNELSKMISEFLNFPAESKQSKYGLPKAEQQAYEKTIDDFKSLPKIKNYLELGQSVKVRQFPRFGVPKKELKNLSKGQEVRNGVNFDEIKKPFYAEGEETEDTEKKDKNDKGDKSEKICAYPEDLEKGMLFEEDRIFWTTVREYLMKTLPPKIACLEDEAKKKSKVKQYRERIWNIFQNALAESKTICMNMIELEDKKNTSEDKGKNALSFLLEEGADVNNMNKDGFTPLMMAARNGHVDTLKALLEAPGLDVNLKNKFGSNAMHYAAMYAHKECVMALREKDRAQRQSSTITAEKMYNDKNKLNQTPYHLAKAEEDEIKLHKETMWKQKVVKESQFKLVPEIKEQKKGAELELAFPAVLYKGLFKMENPEAVKPPSKEFKPAREGQAHAWRISKIPDPALKRDDFDEQHYIDRWKEAYKKCKPAGA